MEQIGAADLARMWRLGWAKLEELRTPLGYNASEGGSGLYAALFGRDSLWILLFLLDVAARRPLLAGRVQDAGARILGNLARLQGTRELDLIEEQPGKIIHEHWLTEPEPPAVHVLPLLEGNSYCGFDQTFLFVIAVRRFLELFPDSALRATLWPAAWSAIDWIGGYALQRESGLYAYRRRHSDNPVHQVWKDSFDSITHAGFDIPEPPVAWIEVQGYAYRALLDAADLSRRFEGRDDMADSLEAEAERLRKRVDDTFWLDDEGCYAVAVDGAGRPVRMVTSNPGHALWAGLPDQDRAVAVAGRLAAPDVLSGYGLRTLSASDRFFAPHAYHRGTVWPFDNVVVAGGLLKYGLEEQARAVMAGIVRGLSLIGSTIELYVVVPSEGLVKPAASMVSGPELLLNRRIPPENVNQGFTAAGLLFCVDALARMDGVELE